MKKITTLALALVFASGIAFTENVIETVVADNEQIEKENQENVVLTTENLETEAAEALVEGIETATRMVEEGKIEELATVVDEIIEDVVEVEKKEETAANGISTLSFEKNQKVQWFVIGAMSVISGYVVYKHGPAAFTTISEKVRSLFSKIFSRNNAQTNLTEVASSSSSSSSSSSQAVPATCSSTCCSSSTSSENK